jgi:hypothetical protein
MLQLLGLVAMFAALAPVCMAGGNMVAAFVMRRQMLGWLLATVGCMLALVAGAMLALQTGAADLADKSGAAAVGLMLLACGLMIAPPWGAYALAKRLLEKQP